ncbi:MAG: ribonuclease J, partial [Malacoplasma sp.]
TRLLEDRKIISEDGIFNVVVLIDRINKKVLKKPILSTRGCFYAKESTALMSKISYSIKDDLEQLLSKIDNKVSDNEIITLIKKTINYFIWKNKKKRPMILVSIFG